MSSSIEQQTDAAVETVRAAARSVLLANGVQGTRMTDIARKAGVAKGTLYLRFESKEALLDDLVQDAVDFMLTKPNPTPSPEACVFDALLDEYLSRLRTERMRAAASILKVRSTLEPIVLHRFFRDMSFGYQTALDEAQGQTCPAKETPHLTSRSVLRLLLLNSLFYSGQPSTDWLEREGEAAIRALSVTALTKPHFKDSASDGAGISE